MCDQLYISRQSPPKAAEQQQSQHCYYKLSVSRINTDALGIRVLIYHQFVCSSGYSATLLYTSTFGGLEVGVGTLRHIVSCLHAFRRSRCGAIGINSSVGICEKSTSNG